MWAAAYRRVFHIFERIGSAGGTRTHNSTVNSSTSTRLGDCSATDRSNAVSASSTPPNAKCAQL